ncbi:MAG: tyrosine-type recombinase/integrase [Firmicutes bacterium]|nr:tyrosine-type recombinase/integrase [Bacillota bacterium]
MDHIEEFKLYLKTEKTASDSTCSAYLGDLKEFDAYLLQERGKTPETAGNADIAAYLMALKSSGRNPSTVNRKMSSVRCYYAFLLEKGKVMTNPAAGIRSPKMAPKALDYLTVEQMESLLDIDGTDPKSLRDKAILELMYATGMRAGEMASADVKDADLKIGFIVCSTEGKSRIIPIGKPALEALKTYLQQARPALVKADSGESALFVNYQGSRITRQGIWKLIRFYGEKAGLGSGLNPQVMRNSFAAHMLQNGADLKSLQELMGLEDINAAKLYLTVTKKRIMDVYDKTHPRAMKP